MSCRLLHEQEIVQTQRLMFERLKIVVEPSAAVAFAAVRTKRFKEMAKKAGVKGAVGIVISGGNVDLEKAMAWLK